MQNLNLIMQSRNLLSQYIRLKSAHNMDPADPSGECCCSEPGTRPAVVMSPDRILLLSPILCVSTQLTCTPPGP